jgi:hypothetical protein
VALGFINLSALYFDEGNFAEAAPLLERSLTIRERTLGPDHPLVIRHGGPKWQKDRLRCHVSRTKQIGQFASGTEISAGSAPGTHSGIASWTNTASPSSRLTTSYS